MGPFAALRVTGPFAPLRVTASSARERTQPAPEALKCRRVLAEPAQLAGREGRDQRLGGRDAVLLQWVGSEERLQRVRVALSLAQENREHLRNPAWVDPGPDRGPHSLRVGLVLVGPAELREQRAAAHVDRGLARAALAHLGEGAEHGDARPGALHLLHLLHRMPEGDVGDLVPQDAGQLAHVLDPLDQPAIHVDPASGNRKGVHLLAVHHLEMPGEAPGVGHPRQRAARAGDVGIHLAVPHQGKLLLDLGGSLGAQLDFLLLGDGAGGSGPDQGDGRETRGGHGGPGPVEAHTTQTTPDKALARGERSAWWVRSGECSGAAATGERLRGPSGALVRRWDPFPVRNQRRSSGTARVSRTACRGRPRPDYRGALANGFIATMIRWGRARPVTTTNRFPSGCTS